MAPVRLMVARAAASGSSSWLPPGAADDARAVSINTHASRAAAATARRTPSVRGASRSAVVAAAPRASPAARPLRRGAARSGRAAGVQYRVVDPAAAISARRQSMAPTPAASMQGVVSSRFVVFAAALPRQLGDARPIVRDARPKHASASSPSSSMAVNVERRAQVAGVHAMEATAVKAVPRADGNAMSAHAAALGQALEQQRDTLIRVRGAHTNQPPRATRDASANRRCATSMLPPEHNIASIVPFSIAAPEAAARKGNFPRSGQTSHRAGPPALAAMSGPRPHSHQRPSL